ncbi:MAG: hypothetical protein QOE50_1371, partial [Sphingomonadales bacterium]|nr:hypothetical protein [Sphingomonadales bacterium]
HPGRGKQSIGGGERVRISAARTAKQRLRLLGEGGPAGHAVKRGAPENADQFPRWRTIGAAPEPQRRPATRRIKRGYGRVASVVGGLRW